MICPKCKKSMVITEKAINPIYLNTKSGIPIHHDKKYPVWFCKKDKVIIAPLSILKERQNNIDKQNVEVLKTFPIDQFMTHKEVVDLFQGTLSEKDLASEMRKTDSYFSRCVTSLFVGDSKVKMYYINGVYNALNKYRQLVCQAC